MHFGTQHLMYRSNLYFSTILYGNLMWHESIGHAGNYLFRYQYDPFLFFVAEVMSSYLTTGGLKNFSLLPEAPLRPEARGICHICHIVNPALLVRRYAPRRATCNDRSCQF